MRTIVGCCLLLLATTASAFGAEWYVDNVGGSDVNDGRSADNSIPGSGPFRSINRALRAARRSDTVILRDTGVPYREAVSVQGGRNSGTALLPFRLVGNGAVLDGTRPIPPLAWEHFEENVFRYRPYRLQFQTLFDAGVPLQEIEPGPHQTVPKLEPRQWAFVGSHIYFRTEPGKLPLDYDLSCAFHPVGVTLYEVRHVEISDLIVQGYQVDGVNAHSNAFDVSIADVVARGNGRSGVSVGGASRASLLDSLVGDNRVAQVRAEGYARLTIAGCELLENPAPATVEEGGFIERAKLPPGAPAVVPAAALLTPEASPTPLTVAAP